MTVGPWRPIYLRTYNSKITDLRVSTNVDEDLIPHIEVQLAATSANGEFEVSIMSASGTIIKSGSTNLSNGEGKLIFDSAKGDFDLWWPVGYGKQPLYKVVAQLKDEVNPTIFILATF
jgi:beta-mannosidase